MLPSTKIIIANSFILDGVLGTIGQRNQGFFQETLIMSESQPRTSLKKYTLFESLVFTSTYYHVEKATRKVKPVCMLETVGGRRGQICVLDVAFSARSHQIHTNSMIPL